MFKRDSVKTFGGKLFLLLFSIIISFAVWFYISYNENPEIKEYFTGIPIEYTGQEALTEKNLIVTGISTDNLNLRVSGKRLAVAKLNKEDISVNLDLSSVDSPGTHQLECNVDFGTKVSSGSVSVEDSTSRYVTVTVKKLVTKELEVRGVFDGNIAENCIGDALECSPSTIEIRGPEDEVSKASYAWVVMTKDELSKTYSEVLPYTVLDEDGNAIVSENIVSDTESVTLTQHVSMIKEVPLVVNLIYNAGANADNTVSEIEPKSVIVSGDPETLEGLNQITIATVNTSDFQSSMTESYGIIIPDGCVNKTGETSANVKIRVVGLETTKISVDNIQVTGETEGYSTEIITKTLDVTLRGSKEDIEAVKAENIRIVSALDEIGTSEGVFSAGAKIVIDGFTDIGAIGNYTVNVKITKGTSNTNTTENESLE